MIKSFRAAALAVVALAALAMPALATDLPVDGNLRFQCSTVTASAGAATLNNKCGTVTSETLATASGSTYTLTLTNSTVAAADVVAWSIDNGTNTTGALSMGAATAAAGSVVFLVRNPKDGAAGTGAAWSGNIKIKYLIIKP